MNKYGKKVYNEITEEWEWSYTKEERELMRKEMEQKPHTKIYVVEEEIKGKYIYQTLSNGQVVKVEKPKENVAGIRGGTKGIPFNPNRSYIQNDDWEWGGNYDRFEMEE